MSIIELAQYRPQRLDEEPWGSRMTRAREAANFTIRTAADAIGQFSHASITRLEALTAPPTATRMRQRAILLVVLYGFDPADFGLTEDDVPPVIDLKTVRELGKRSTIWETAPFTLMGDRAA